MKPTYLVAVITMATIFFACHSSVNDKHTQLANDTTFDLKQEENKFQAPADTATIPPPGQEPPAVQQQKFVDWDKKVVKTGHLAVEVEDYKQYRNKLASLIKSSGGYIASEHETKTDERLENNLTIKVPVHYFQDVMDHLSNIGKITSKEITSQDVTTEVIDTKSRIEAKKKIRQRYTELLQQAKSMDEILKIQSEINDVQEQIEMASGRVVHLNQSSAFSTIHLRYYQILITPVKDDKTPSFANRVAQAFVNGWSVIKEALIGLVTLWPLWLAGVGWFIFIKKRKPVAAKAR